MGTEHTGRTTGGVLVCLLGGFRILKLGSPINIRPGGRAQSIFSALALGPRPTGIPRDDLVQLLWPETEAGPAVQALHTLVYSLHRSLGDALDGQGPIVNVDGRYRLNTEAGVEVDVDRFDGVVDAADRLVRVGEPDAALRSYRDAVGLYAGDLVVGSEVQHVLERERLRARYLRVRATLANHHLAKGEMDVALGHALDILAHDPYREDAHRMAMRCYVRLGLRAQALRQYRICRDVLMTEFEAPPERATEELYELVRLEPVRV